MKNIIESIQSFGVAGTVQTGMVLIGNGKTGKALESRVESGVACPLMKKVDGHMTAPLCPSCYAVSVFNNYPGVRGILTSENHSLQDIIMRAAGIEAKNITGAPVYPGDRLRIYGLTDFRPRHFATLKALSRIYKIDIISKTLWHFKPCREFLPELARLPGVCISLSFNKKDGLAALGGFKTIEESIAACRTFVRRHKIGNTTSLNYTFTTGYREDGKSELEPYRRIPGVRVYHTVSRDKGALAAAIGVKGVCGMFDEVGRPITDFKKFKGSCLGCNFCRKGTAA